MAFLHNLSAFFIYFVSAMGLMAVFMAVYLHITPHAEIAQIRRGNMAATVSQPFEDMAAKAASIVESMAVNGKTADDATGGRKIIYMDAPLIDKNNLPK